MSAVLGGVVGPAVAHPVPLRERAVEQNVVGIGLAQHLEQARCTLCQQADHRGGVSVGGAHRDTEASGDLGECVVLAQVRQSDQDTLVRWEFAPSATLPGEDEHRDPLDQGVRQVECDAPMDVKAERAAGWEG